MGDCGRFVTLTTFLAMLREQRDDVDRVRRPEWCAEREKKRTNWAADLNLRDCAVAATITAAMRALVGRKDCYSFEGSRWLNFWFGLCTGLCQSAALAAVCRLT